MANISNNENLYGMNLPRGSFALSGGQFAESLSDINGKLPTDGPPMIIVDTPPGVASTDTEWVKTFGASRDAYLTIINGRFLQTAIDEMSVDGIYRQGSVNIITDNLWMPADTADGAVQQIQYIVSKETINEASEATESFGEIEEARGIGIRVPGMAGGYGRTIDGLPTDPEPTTDSSKRQNDEEHKVARETWKYGPVEYRWDYRKGVWSAYNELIADHEEEELGTWVFSTNPDGEKGFPFLRGKLEDVWWVRQPFDLQGTDGTEEGVKTGEIMTHLEHRFYDENEKACAKLSSIFIIPHEQSATAEGEEGCHFQAEDIQELGEETTANAERIDLKYDVHFFKEKGVDGAIHLGQKVTDLTAAELMCCYNPEAKYFIGEMVFVDEMPPGCGDGGGGGAASATGTDPHQCKWVPSVQIDECELMGHHMVKLVTNDLNLGVRISEFCNIVTDWTGDLAGAIDSNIGAISSAIDCLTDKMLEMQAAANVAIAVTFDQGVINVDSHINDIEFVIQQLVADLNTALLACGCEESLDPLDYQLYRGTHGEAPGSFAVTVDCQVGTTSRIPTLDCAECYGTELQGPCTTQESFVAGEPCGGGNPPNIDTEYGNCMTHEDIA